ncbi:alpha/beta fold hydrolase [Actinomycetospora sp. CA-084318]|uniref:alpha/beta fold hydrolase n=1 Tax=Actinomycetospora sp. CA-084318 TaxID=3239892 RepID=UPI003D95F775
MDLLRRALVVAVLLVLVAPVPASGSTRCGADVPGLAPVVVETGAVRLHAVVGGPPEAPPVVLLHGFPETWRTWRTAALDLAADHRVLVPDLRGAGCSGFGPVPDPDARALAGDLAGLVTALGVGPAVVVGHDMGAMPAYAWARSRPDQVRHLVLSGGGVPGRGLEELAPPHVAAFAAAPPGRLAAEVAGHEREVLAGFVGDPAVVASGSLDDAVRAYSAPGRYDAAMGRYRALPRDAARNRLDPGPLAVPATALEGGAPGISAATLPGADVVVVPGAGHYLQEDRPHETAAAIRAIAGRA